MKNLVEVDFHDFRALLAKAAREGHRLERTDRKGWSQFLRSFDVPEGACLYHAKQNSMSGEVQTVIITGSADKDGLYLYSDDDLFCLRYIVEAQPPAAAASDEASAPAPEEAAAETPAEAPAETPADAPADASADTPATEPPASTDDTPSS